MTFEKLFNLANKLISQQGLESLRSDILLASHKGSITDTEYMILRDLIIIKIRALKRIEVVNSKS